MCQLHQKVIIFRIGLFKFKFKEHVSAGLRNPWERGSAAHRKKSRTAEKKNLEKM